MKRNEQVFFKEEAEEAKAVATRFCARLFMAALVGTDLLEVGDWADGRQHRIHSVELGVGQGPDARQAVPSLLGPKAEISS